jgi:hypothetical protein
VSGHNCFLLVFDYEASHPVFDDFRDGTSVECDDGRAAGHCFNQNQAKRLGPGDCPLEAWTKGLPLAKSQTATTHPKAAPNQLLLSTIATLAIKLNNATIAKKGPRFIWRALP